MTIHDIPTQLAREFRQLGQGSPFEEAAQAVATFSVRPWEAYTLVASLQATSRHPGLSDRQREIVLGFAHQVAEQLVAMARALVGPESAIETTTNMGFEPQFDIARDEDAPRSLEVILGGQAEEVHFEHLNELEDVDDDDDDEPDSHVIGERRCRYVEPAVIRLTEREAEMQLQQCAACSRFFLQDMPIEFFQDLGADIVLGFHVCERCAPKVLSQMRGGS